MSSAAIPFAQGLNSGLSELSGMGQVQTNFLVDPAGALRVRPGIALWEGFAETTISNTSPIIGMFAWRDWLLFVRYDRTIAAWQASGPGGVLELSDATAATKLDGTGRPIWTYDSDRVVVTGGGKPQQWQGVGISSRLAAAATAPDGSPLTATHIAYSAQRLIVNINDNSGTVQWTAPGASNHTTWPIVGPYYMEAEASPDPVLALFANSNEVFVFGATTTQVLQPDATIAFVTGPAIEAGVSARYSIIPTEEGNFGWLDDNQRFLQSSGRGFEVISDPGMTAAVKELGTISDCWGCNIMIGSTDLLVWNFPTDKRSLYFDRATKKWGEFRSLNANGDWVAWLPQSYFYWDDRRVHLVGLDDGTIGELSFSYGDDMGQTIRAISRPGFQDQGTFNRKMGQRVDLQLKRGDTAPPATAPVVELRYRDDLGAWKSAKRFSMGAGQYQPVVTAWAQGMYIQRQYELQWSGGGGFLLAGATEQFSVGEV